MSENMSTQQTAHDAVARRNQAKKPSSCLRCQRNDVHPSVGHAEQHTGAPLPKGQPLPQKWSRVESSIPLFSVRLYDREKNLSFRRCLAIRHIFTVLDRYCSVLGRNRKLRNRSLTKGVEGRASRCPQ